MADFIPPEARKSEKTWQPPETKEKKSDVSPTNCKQFLAEAVVAQYFG